MYRYLLLYNFVLQKKINIIYKILYYDDGTPGVFLQFFIYSSVSRFSCSICRYSYSTYISKAVRIRFVYKPTNPVHVVVTDDYYYERRTIVLFLLRFSSKLYYTTLSANLMPSIYLPMYNTVFYSINCIISLYIIIYLYCFFVVGSLTFTSIFNHWLCCILYSISVSRVYKYYKNIYKFKYDMNWWVITRARISMENESFFG